MFQTSPRLLLLAGLVGVAAIALVGLLALAAVLWGATDVQVQQLTALRTEAGTAPTGTAQLDTRDLLALEKDLLLVENGVAATRGQLFGSLAQLAVGAAVLGGLVFTWRNLRLAQQNLRLAESGQRTERFTKAIGQLGDEKLAVRLGGIYALEQLARDAPEVYRRTVIDVLTAFLRERTSRLMPDDPERSSPVPPESDQIVGRPQPPADVVAMLTVLARCTRAAAPTGPEFDLSYVDLSGWDLRAVASDADLKRARLWRANLAGAMLMGADLENAHLQGANLHAAYLQLANLRKADLEEANLEEAWLQEADLHNADLRGTLFRKSDVAGAHFAGAIVGQTEPDVGPIVMTDFGAAYGLTVEMLRSMNGALPTDEIGLDSDLRRKLEESLYGSSA